MNAITPEPTPTLEIPAAGNRCIDVLEDTLSGYTGIHSAEFDLSQGRLLLNYDPQVLSQEHALGLVRKAGEQAYGRVTQCAVMNEKACAACAAAMNNGLAASYRRLAASAAPGSAPAASYRDGVVELRLPASEGDASAQAEAILAGAPARSLARLPAIPRPALEIAFTAVTLLAALAAWLGQTSGLLPGLAVGGLYALAFLAGGYYGLQDALNTLRERRLDVNLLMILAALGAAVIGQPAEGAALLFLFSLSNTLQSYAMGRSRKAIEKLLDLRPKLATVRRGSRLVSLPVEKVVVGDAALVRPGERFPVDGQVLAGSSTADQATITGESMPVQKDPGDVVFAGTVNGNGALEVRVTRLAQDSTLARLVHMVEEAQGSKARTQRLLDNFEQVYALLVLGGAGLLIVLPPVLFGEAFASAFYRAMTWLVVASPCALVISTPASFLSAIANGARRGILFKGGVHLEQTATLNVIAFDKTGTLTSGSPKLTSLTPLNGLSEPELLRLAASAEARSEHPLARAIVQAAEGQRLPLAQAAAFQAIPGLGVEAQVDGRTMWIGSARLFEQRGIVIPGEILRQAHALEDQGQTVMLLNAGGEWLGLLGVADTLRPEAAAVLAELKRGGVKRLVMLTGDNPRVARSIAKQAGIDEFHAGLLPEAKVELLKQLRARYGPIAMVGDGVNDAPALATADVGIAMGGAGSDVALETADVILMGDRLERLPYAIGLARQARRVVWQNLAFSLAVIVLLVASAFGANLPLPLGVVGHEGSTVLVVLNGLRLLAFRR